jgi:hypothetical protein
MRHGTLFRLMWICLLLGTAALGATIRLRVTAEIANLREKPDIGSNVVRQVPRGTLLESSAKEGDWYLVTLRDESARAASGYVHESLVALITPEEEPQTPAGNPEPARTEPVTRPPEKVPAKRQESAQAYAQESLFSLALSGGGNLVLGGDLNKGTRGLADYYLDSLNAQTLDEVNPVGLGFVGGGELSFPLAEKISLGVGVEYLTGSRQSLVHLAKGSYSYSFTARPALWAIPVRAFLAYAPVPFISLKIGVEYIFAHAGYYYRWEAASNDWQEWTGEADARGLGVFGGLGLEWSLSPNFGLVLELSGRYAPLTGFSGTGTYLDSEAVTSQEEGKLYYYETRVADAVYSLLFIRSRVPSEAGVYNPRPAEVDFTGAALRAGFKLKF